MSLKEFIKELNGNKVEGEIIKTAIYSLSVSLAVFILFYYFSLKNIPEFFSKYGFYILLSILGYTCIFSSARQIRLCGKFPCMSGMMIGMTIGMIGGFLSGYYVGATNGLFIGTLFGMIVGILLGIWLGSSCGVMGFMEGAMAGFMAGPMGAMTSVMLIYDNVKLMGIIFLFVALVILAALKYMVFLEAKGERQLNESLTNILLLSGFLTALTIVVICFGPRSGVFS